MPWPERSPMDQRRQLVQVYRSGLFTMTELAEQYGISRKTGYKWIGRTAGDGGGAEWRTALVVPTTVRARPRRAS